MNKKQRNIGGEAILFMALITIVLMLVTIPRQHNTDSISNRVESGVIVGNTLTMAAVQVDENIYSFKSTAFKKGDKVKVTLKKGNKRVNDKVIDAWKY